MKLYAVAGALLAGALLAGASALPAAAQDTWLDPQAILRDPASVLHHIYIEGEGGATVQGRAKVMEQAQGLGSSYESTSLSTDAFGGALIGIKLAPPVALEAEGFYSRENLYFSPASPTLGIGGATRTYGGFGNLRLSFPYLPSYTPQLGRFSVPVTVEPYIAPGIGRGNITYTGRNGITSYDAERDGFIYQGKAGVEFRAGPFGLDVAYRYIQAPNFNHPDNFNSSGYSAYARSSMQVVTAGLKYYF